MANENKDTEKPKLDETIPGGLYIVDGYVRNAEGEIVKGYSVSKDGKSIEGEAKTKPETK